MLFVVAADLQASRKVSSGVHRATAGVLNLEVFMSLVLLLMVWETWSGLEEWRLSFLMLCCAGCRRMRIGGILQLSWQTLSSSARMLRLSSSEHRL